MGDGREGRSAGLPPEQEGAPSVLSEVTVPINLKVRNSPERRYKQGEVGR